MFLGIPEKYYVIAFKAHAGLLHDINSIMETLRLRRDYHAKKPVQADFPYKSPLRREVEGTRKSKIFRSLRGCGSSATSDGFLCQPSWHSALGATTL